MQSSLAAQTKNIIWPLLLLAVLSLALFWPATGYDFVKLDDDQYICRNLHVTTGLSVTNIRWAFSTVYEDWWLPMLWISFMADTSLFGPEPFGYHLTNILLHTANALLLFWVLFRMTGSRWRSFFVAALFALHPLRIESVAWITARKDVLSGFFFCLSLLAYIRHVNHPSIIRRLLLSAFMILGLMSKAIMIILPFLLLLLDFWPLQRARFNWTSDVWRQWRPLLREKTELFAFSLIFIAINLITHHDNVLRVNDLSGLDRLGLVFPNYWTYLGNIFWPSRLSILYPEHDIVNWAISIPAAIGLVVITFVTLRIRKSCPYGIVGWLWFLLALFPVIRGVRLGLAAYTDRFAYLPSIGLAIALVWGTVALAKHVPPRGSLFARLLAILLLATLFFTARNYLPCWADSNTMFSRLIRLEPNNALANNSFGKVLLEQGKTEESLPYFMRAAALGDPMAPSNYADALIRLGRDDQAIAWLKQALAKLDSHHPALNTLLALAYLNTDRASDAIPHFLRALQSDSTLLSLHIGLVRAHYESGNPEAAQCEIQVLQSLGYSHIRDFDSLIAYYANLWQSGESLQAWHFFRNNLRSHPDHIVLLNNAAWFLATTPNPPASFEEALLYARRAVELAPVPHPSILDTYAAALAANGQFDHAIATAQQAIDLARKNGDETSCMQISQRLAIYQQHQPWHE